MFVTLATLKAFLGIPVADTTRDAMLQVLVDAANQQILDILNLSSTTVTAYQDRIDVDDESTPILMTRRWPVVAVSQVTENGTVVDPTTYSVNELGALKILGTRFWGYGREAVVVDYTAGWAGSPPADLAYAAMLIAAFGSNTAGKAGLDSETIGQYSYRMGGGASGGSGGSGGFGIPPEAERILASWRRVFSLPN